jgi:hypothetical protein
MKITSLRLSVDKIETNFLQYRLRSMGKSLARTTALKGK